MGAGRPSAQGFALSPRAPHEGHSGQERHGADAEPTGCEQEGAGSVGTHAFVSQTEEEIIATLRACKLSLPCQRHQRCSLHGSDVNCEIPPHWLMEQHTELHSFLA